MRKSIDNNSEVAQMIKGLFKKCRELNVSLFIVCGEEINGKSKHIDGYGNLLTISRLISDAMHENTEIQHLIQYSDFQFKEDNGKPFLEHWNRFSKIQNTTNT